MRMYYVGLQQHKYASSVTRGKGVFILTCGLRSLFQLSFLLYKLLYEYHIQIGPLKYTLKMVLL